MDEQQSLNQTISRAVKDTPVSEVFRQRLELRLKALERQRRWRGWSLRLALAASILLLFWNVAAPTRTEHFTLDLVGHHETCWEVPSSGPRSQQFQTWVQSHPDVSTGRGDKLGRGLQLFDRRGCPVLASTRSPHWMYRDSKGDMVSVFLFTPGELNVPTALAGGIHRDSCGPYQVLTWSDRGCLWAMVAQAPAEQMEDWIRKSALSGFDPQRLGKTIAAVAP